MRVHLFVHTDKYAIVEMERAMRFLQHHIIEVKGDIKMLRAEMDQHEHILEKIEEQENSLALEVDLVTVEDLATRVRELRRESGVGINKRRNTDDVSF